MPSFTPKPTKHVLKLADALKKRGVALELEHWDGHKHIDIYIPKDHLYIEVDGVPHYTDHQKMIADFNREYFSFKGGYFTKRIANETIESHVEEIADAIATVAENAPNRLGERVLEK
jgi:very-short-patch-repair endonuclease